MANIYDNNFGDDGAGPDTDPTPDFEQLSFDFDDIDQTNYEEPGEGDTFSGQDPSVWEGRGNPENPEAQDSVVVAAVETTDHQADDQDATRQTDFFSELDDPNDPDNEDDSSDPAQVDSSAATDSSDEVQYQEQTPVTTEVTVEEPERIESEVPQDERAGQIPFPDKGPTPLDEFILDTLGWSINDLNSLEQTYARAAAAYERRLDRRLDRSLDKQDLALDFRLESAIEAWDFQHTPEFLEAQAILEEEFDRWDQLMTQDSADEPLFEELFTEASLLADFGDVLGSIDQETMLTEFQFLGQDNI